MIIYNPTSEAVVAKHDGATYLFKPGEQKDVFNSYAATHILSRWNKYGLVNVTFDQKIAKKFPDPESYTQEQRLKGLLAWMSGLEIKLQRYEAYENECGDKPSTERLYFKKEEKKVRELLEKAQGLYEEAQATTPDDLLEARRQKLKAEMAKIDAELGSITKEGEIKHGSNTKRNKVVSKDRTA